MENNTLPDESVAVRVRRILDDMAHLRETLVAGDAAARATTGAAPPPLDMQLAAELKSAVDSTRQVLWLYMKWRCAGTGATPQQITDWYKMELAVEMLRLMRSRPTQAQAQGNVVEMIPSGIRPPAGQGGPHA
jgi:hypothetical protein